jgi:hypothetical protein
MAVPEITSRQDVSTIILAAPRQLLLSVTVAETTNLMPS